jgi:very-short-patch-repair endonuclease
MRLDPQEERRRWLLEARAQENRRRPTSSELRLWRALRGGALGVAFRRQVVIGAYIADFAARGVRVVVEVDGASHRGRELADARRDAALRCAGWRVVRVEAAQVMRRVEDAVALVRAAVEAESE